ncbi:MAG: class I SAM-dependent methyltransferase [Saprospiraceae bacterium]|nr:class I SAM-dependent methyltransferase [Saprospiraceae bacterium]
MLKLLWSYLKFWWRSKNQHGVHSPFVFKLVTECFYDKTKFENYKELKQYRLALLSNKNSIDVTDLGVGSHIMKTHKRRIADMTKNAGSTLSRTQLLYRFASYFKPNSILELGSSMGIATHAMSLARPNASIISIEGCPNITEFTSNQLKSHGCSNVMLINNEFSEGIENLSQEYFDLMYIDGNHQKEATLKYFELLLEKSHNDSIMIFDDIYWSKGMTEAWDIIVSHPRVTVSIDTFFWGIVFFRKEQVKEHFIIRL